MSKISSREVPNGTKFDLWCRNRTAIMNSGIGITVNAENLDKEVHLKISTIT